MNFFDFSHGPSMSFNIAADDFAQNSEPRPCVILADQSYSMEGEKIHELNKALPLLKSSIESDPMAGCIR